MPAADKYRHEVPSQKLKELALKHQGLILNIRRLASDRQAGLQKKISEQSLDEALALLGMADLIAKREVLEEEMKNLDRLIYETLGQHWRRDGALYQINHHLAHGTELTGTLGAAISDVLQMRGWDELGKSLLLTWPDISDYDMLRQKTKTLAEVNAVIQQEQAQHLVHVKSLLKGDG